MDYNSWRWKEGLQFALCWKLESQASPAYVMNFAEKYGSSVVHPLYALLDWCSHHLRKPHIIILLTLILAVAISVAFYHVPLFIFLDKFFPAYLIRFLCFVYTELLVIGMGCRTFGRFQNKQLVTFWKKQQLTPLFPGKSRN